MYVLRREQFLRRPVSDVFAFFARPENLARITPPWLHFVMLTPSPVPMEEGAKFDCVVHVLGIRMRWTVLVTQYDPPHLFRDEQLKGPYQFWEHRHEFVEKDGGTLLIDEVRYRVPFGVMGKIAHALYIRRALQRVFDFREETTALLLDA